MSRVDGGDLVAVVGLGMVGLGCWLIRPALALLVVGGVFVVCGVMRSLVGKGKKKG